MFFSAEAPKALPLVESYTANITREDRADRNPVAGGDAFDRKARHALSPGRTPFPFVRSSSGQMAVGGSDAIHVREVSPA
jgi:hypothetical protein